MKQVETNIDNNILDVLIVTKKLYVDYKYVGHINYSINLYCKDSYIININILKHQRNKGYGTFLLQECLSDIKSKYIKKVKLNDISSNYRKQNNIYVKFGFKYQDNYNNDMIIIYDF